MLYRFFIFYRKSEQILNLCEWVGGDYYINLLNFQLEIFKRDELLENASYLIKTYGQYYYRYIVKRKDVTENLNKYWHIFMAKKTQHQKDVIHYSVDSI